MLSPTEIRRLRGMDPDDALLEAYRLGLEDAANICDEQANEPECPERAKYCADAIRALAETLKGEKK